MRFDVAFTPFRLLLKVSNRGWIGPLALGVLSGIPDLGRWPGLV
jgi:hypothetical protein